MRAKIPWARVLAEGTAIVVSILLAFGIQAGWERRQEGDDASRALEALRQDFTANRDTLSLLVSDHTLWADELAWFYATPLEEHLASPRSDSIAERVLASFVLQITYDPTVGSLETLLRGGRIGVIQSAELENALWLWERQLSDSQEEAQLLIGTVNTTIQEFVRLGIFDPRLPEEPPPGAIEKLWRSDALASQASILELWRGSYVSELESLLRLTDSVLALIDAR